MAAFAGELETFSRHDGLRELVSSTLRGDVARSVERVSVTGIALLGPRVASVVVTAGFPETGRIAAEDFDALQPLRAFPEIQMRHYQPHRAAVLRLQRRARPAMREQGVLGGKIFQREISGVAVMRMQHDVPRFVARLAGHQE